MTPERRQAHDELFSVFDRMSEIAADLHRICYLSRATPKPLIGGSFGAGRFYLTSVGLVIGGLHDTRFFILEAESGAVISFGENKQQALAIAREALARCDPLLLSMYFGRRKASLEAAVALRRKKEQEEQAERFARERAARKNGTVKSISRRRKRIFDESGGKCHYCGVALTLDGKWHVEHKMPKALGGTNEPGNLVASCVPCNHEKIDTTDIEYKAKRAARGQA